MKVCRELRGEREAVVEFDYDGVVPSAPLATSLSMSVVYPIGVKAIDKDGNVRYEDFTLAEISPRHIATLTHGDQWEQVSSVSFSPDGETLAAGGARTVELWDVVTKTIIATIAAVDWGTVSSVSFSPDGTTIASGGEEGSVKLWDMDTKTNIAILEAHHRGNKISLSFSPDEKTLSTGSGNGSVKLWDVDTKTNITTIEEPRFEGNVSSASFSPTVAFSPDGKTLAVGALDDDGFATVKLWDVDTKTSIAPFEATGTVTSVAFAPNGVILAVGSGATVQVWDVDTKAHIATFGVTGTVTSVAFAPDGATLAAGSRDDTVQLWDVSEWTRSPPHSLVKTSGEGQEGPASTQLAAPFVVSVLDEDGEAIVGEVVTFAVTAGGGMLSSTTAITDANPCTVVSSTSSTTATTDANGRAATRLTLGSQPGTNTVEATVAELDTVVTFTATATGQAMPHSLTKVCGEDQEGIAGEQLDESFVVSVSDEDGAVMAGVVVSFSVTAGEGTLSSAMATTDANGRAATRLTLGSEPGTNTVEATVAGLEPATFTAVGQEESPLADFFDVFLGGGKRVALPDSPQLAQNAPNPFNSQTVLAYFLHAPGPARVEVFALSGQQVAVLHQGPQQAGYHRLHWNGHDDAGRLVASGMYLYRLVTDETVLTRKLTLLR